MLVLLAIHHDAPFSACQIRFTFIEDVMCVCLCDVIKLPKVFSALKVSKKFVSPNMQLVVTLNLLMHGFRTDVWLTVRKLKLMK